MKYDLITIGHYSHLTIDEQIDLYVNGRNEETEIACQRFKKRAIQNRKKWTPEEKQKFLELGIYTKEEINKKVRIKKHKKTL